MSTWRRPRLFLVIVAAALLGLSGAGSAATAAPRGESRPVIIGGEAAASGAWPAAVAIGLWGSAPARAAFCGGTLIAPQWVITAAHCVQGLQPRNIAVHTGHHWLRSRKIATLEVERVLRARWIPRLDRNDLALLRLASPVQSEVMELARRKDYRAGKWATILGWGSTREDGRGKSAWLRQGRLRLAEDSQCRRLWRYVNPRRQVCAGLTTYRTVVDSCYGDSGGPLVLTGTDGTQRLGGIASYGARMCGTPRRPAVYTKVAAYDRWIKRRLSRYPSDPAPPSSEPTAPAGPSAPGEPLSDQLQRQPGARR